MRRRERVLERSMRLAKVGSWVWHADTESVEWSEQMYSITGVDRGVTPTTELFHSLVHEDDRPRVLQIAALASTTGRAEPHEYRILRASDGALRYVQTSGEVLFDDDGAVLGFVGATLDLTEQHEMNERLREGQKLEAIGRLASGMAHDFNNLLTVILTSVAILELEAGDAGSSQPAQDIRQAAERAATLTRQVLAFARRQITAPAIVDLSEVFGGVCDLLRPILPEQIELVREPSPEPVRAFVDRGQLEQVLMNLAVNAMDAMPEGGRLTMQTRVVPGESPRAQIIVTDTGTGIPADAQAHVFEPFYSTKAPGRGTGLGLAMSQGIVSQHGGTLRFETEAGRGTSFIVELPRSSSELTAAPTPAPAAPRTHRRASVLVIEDEPLVRSLVTHILEEDGYIVHSVESLAQLETFLSESDAPLDLALADWSLPDGGGRDVRALLGDRIPASQILFASGFSVDQIEEELVLDPDVSFLPKPFGRNRLLNALDAVLHGRRVRPPT